MYKYKRDGIRLVRKDKKEKQIPLKEEEKEIEQEKKGQRIVFIE